MGDFWRMLDGDVVFFCEIAAFWMWGKEICQGGDDVRERLAVSFLVQAIGRNDCFRQAAEPGKGRMLDDEVEVFIRGRDFPVDAFVLLFLKFKQCLMEDEQCLMQAVEWMFWHRFSGRFPQNVRCGNP